MENLSPGARDKLFAIDDQLETAQRDLHTRLSHRSVYPHLAVVRLGMMNAIRVAYCSWPAVRSRGIRSHVMARSVVSECLRQYALF